VLSILFFFVIPAQAGIQARLAMNKQPAVYILSSKRNGTLYVGVTSDLWTRVMQHKSSVFGGFTAKYGVKTLVWYENLEVVNSVTVAPPAVAEEGAASLIFSSVIRPFPCTLSRKTTITHGSRSQKICPWLLIS